MREKYQQTHAKYQAKVSALLQELSAYSPEMLNKRPADGGWSAIQTAWHLLLVEENSLAYIQKKLGFGGTFEKAGLITHWRNFLLHAALFLPLKFKAPATASGDNLPAVIAIEDLRVRWEKVQKNWADFLAGMPEHLLDRAVFKHPRAGRLSWMQTLVFIESHFDRHVLQIRRALR